MFAFFNGKRSRDLEAFAVALARQIAERCPPALAHERDHLSMSLAKAIDDACAKATEYQREQNLGTYGKAKFGTAFKLQLKESGYPPELVNSMTQQLLLRMSGA